MLQQASDARTEAELERYEEQLETFRQEQLARARTIAERADKLLALVERSLRNHFNADTVLQGHDCHQLFPRDAKHWRGP